MRQRNVVPAGVGLLASSFSVILLLSVLALPAPAGDGNAAETAVADARTARAALQAFGKAVKARAAEERIAAVEALGVHVHEKIADKLLRFSRREDDPAVVAVAFEVLTRQRPFAAEVAEELGERLAKEAKAAAEQLEKGDAGFRIDPRTGDADTTSAVGLAKLEQTRRRSEMLAALVEALVALDWNPEDPPNLDALLQDPSDDLVVAVLDRLGAWQAWAALPAMLDLHRMYPNEYAWETSAVVHLGGTDASAKAAWMRKFGHPDKQRHRPEVVQALQAALRRITGRAFEDPEALAAWMEGREVAERIEKAARRR